jgi:hypothetical protein
MNPNITWDIVNAHPDKPLSLVNCRYNGWVGVISKMCENGIKNKLVSLPIWWRR